MEFLKIIIMAASSLIVLFILTKIMGNRQISELNFFDYIIGITIGSIAAEMASSPDKDFIYPLTAMAVYAAASYLLTVLTEHSKTIRRIILGKTVTLMSKGVMFEKNFKKAKVDINEFLIQSRVNGYFDINEVAYAFLEANGRITFLPKSEYRPLRPDDSKLKVEKESPFCSVVSDGDILSNNLKEISRDEKWLTNKLAEKNIKDINEVFFACSDGNTLRVYKKQNYRQNNDIFQ